MVASLTVTSAMVSMYGEEVEGQRQMHPIEFRPAAPADAFSLAELSIMAGDGMYEFLLDDFAPKEMLAGLMARTMKQDNGCCCWRHCYLAADQGFVVGMINAFPATWLQEEERDVLPADRVQVLDPIDRAQDWNSFLINAVAVRPQYRRQGVGRRLLQWAAQQAAQAGFARMTANVWQDNAGAQALFLGEGFAVQTRVEVPSHPDLRHTPSSLVMARALR